MVMHPTQEATITAVRIKSRHVQRTNCIGEDEDAKDVAWCLLRHPHQGREDDLPRLLLDDLDDRGPFDLFFIQELPEHRRLKDTQANP
jgi:hypothetical protein